MKIYNIVRTPQGVTATVDDKPLRHIPLHSPTGFEFGYGGSGPADLSLAILADYFESKDSIDDFYNGPVLGNLSNAGVLAHRYHQPFKWSFIALATGDFSISESQISEYLTEKIFFAEKV
jgi:hypothetical protein